MEKTKATLNVYGYALVDREKWSYNFEMGYFTTIVIIIKEYKEFFL